MQSFVSGNKAFILTLEALLAASIALALFYAFLHTKGETVNYPADLLMFMQLNDAIILLEANSTLNYAILNNEYDLINASLNDVRICVKGYVKVYNATSLNLITQQNIGKKGCTEANEKVTTRRFFAVINNSAYTPQYFAEIYLEGWPA